MAVVQRFGPVLGLWASVFTAAGMPAAGVVADAQAPADACGTLRPAGMAEHRSGGSTERLPIYRYTAAAEAGVPGDQERPWAVVIQQSMPVYAQAAPRAYALDNHGLSYLCDGITAWQGGSYSTGGCQAVFRQALQLAEQRDGWLEFSPTAPELCVFGFHVEGGRSGVSNCGGQVVGGTRSGGPGRAPLRFDVPGGGGQPFFISTTALTNPGQDLTLSERQIDSTRVPFIVRPGRWSRNHPDAAFELGDHAYVHAPEALTIPGASGGRGSFAVVADTGPSGEFGEGSIALHQMLAFGEFRDPPPYRAVPESSPHPDAAQLFHPYRDTGGGDVRVRADIRQPLWYVVFPGSRNAAGSRHTFDPGDASPSGSVVETGRRAAAAFGGIDRLIGCLEGQL